MSGEPTGNEGNEPPKMVTQEAFDAAMASKDEQINKISDSYKGKESDLNKLNSKFEALETKLAPPAPADKSDVEKINDQIAKLKDQYKNDDVDDTEYTEQYTDLVEKRTLAKVQDLNSENAKANAATLEQNEIENDKKKTISELEADIKGKWPECNDPNSEIRKAMTEANEVLDFSHEDLKNLHNYKRLASLAQKNIDSKKPEPGDGTQVFGNLSNQGGGDPGSTPGYTKSDNDSKTSMGIGKNDKVDAVIKHNRSKMSADDVNMLGDKFELDTF